jgi:hypothetical protein
VALTNRTDHRWFAAVEFCGAQSSPPFDVARIVPASPTVHPSVALTKETAFRSFEVPELYSVQMAAQIWGRARRNRKATFITEPNRI